MGRRVGNGFGEGVIGDYATGNAIGDALEEGGIAEQSTPMVPRLIMIARVCQPRVWRYVMVDRRLPVLQMQSLVWTTA